MPIDINLDVSILGSDDQEFNLSSEQSVLMGLSAEVLSVKELFNATPLVGDVIREAFPQHLEYFEAQASLPLPDLVEVVEVWKERLDAWWQAQKAVRSNPMSLSYLLLRLIAWEEQRLIFRGHAEKEQVQQLLKDNPDADCATVTVVAGDVCVRIPGTFAMTAFNEQGESSGNVLIFSLEHGYWFGSNLLRVGRTLLDHFYQASVWSTWLSDSERDALERAEEVTLQFELLETGPHHYLIADLRAGQRQAITGFLDSQAEAEVQISQLDAAARMETLVAKLEQRTARLISRYRHRLLPEWRRNLQGEELAQYLALESTVQQAQTQCEEQLQKECTPSEFASQRIQTYIHDALGETLDPSQVMLSVDYDYRIDDLEQAQESERQYTLLDFALSGGCSDDRLKVKASDPIWQEKLPQTFLQPMIETLNLRVSFHQQIRSQYEDPIMMKLMRETVDARLALAALAARFQGMPASVYEIVEAARTVDMQAAGVSAARVYLNGETLLGDMLCFVKGETLVLYAPGSPAGDFLVFESLTQLSLEIGSWTITSSGTHYLLAQCLQEQHQALARYLRHIELIPTDWAQHSITLMPFEAQEWEQVLAGVAQQKVVGLLDDLQAVTPQWYLNAEPEQRQRLADLDNQLKVVLTDYQAATKIQAFRGFVHEHVAQRINQIPGGKGDYIDPDTVLVELDPGAVRTLPEVLIKGYPSTFNFSEFANISSSVHQDLSHLDRRVLDGYIRAAKLGEQYMHQLKETFLNPAHPGFRSQRLLHRKMFALRLQRDRLGETLQGRLGQAHAAWLQEVEESFSSSQIDDSCEVYKLELKGCHIEGAYLMCNPADPEELLLYLPEQPSGLVFQTPAQLASAWREYNLGDYFYRRVSISEQPKIGTLIDDQLLNGDGIGLVLDAIGRGDRIVDTAEDFQARIERLIEDVDGEIETVAERISGILVEWGVTLAGILTIPFPPAAMAVGLLCAARSYVRGAMAWWDGDRSAALMYFAAGTIGAFASSGAAGKALDKVMRQLSKLNLKFNLPQLQQASQVVRSPQAKLLMEKLDDTVTDLGGELLPGVYDGFNNELLWLVKYDPVLLH